MKTSKLCLVLNKKSVNRPEVREAIELVRGRGADLDVRIPWDAEDSAQVVRDAVASSGVVGMGRSTR